VTGIKLIFSPSHLEGVYAVWCVGVNKFANRRRGHAFLTREQSAADAGPTIAAAASSKRAAITSCWASAACGNCRERTAVGRLLLITLSLSRQQLPVGFLLPTLYIDLRQGLCVMGVGCERPPPRNGPQSPCAPTPAQTRGARSVFSLLSN
jgi:hypothetical protein